MLTSREAGRYRAIIRRVNKLHANGYTKDTHPDFEPLAKELDALASKLTGPEATRALSRIRP